MSVAIELDQDLQDDHDPIHGAFGLTYASYFVLPRALMVKMPQDWQRAFVQLTRQYWEQYDCRKADKNYTVLLRDDQGKWTTDDLRQYRHMPIAVADSYRLPAEPVQDAVEGAE